jgi:hypothetical protein
VLRFAYKTRKFRLEDGELVPRPFVYWFPDQPAVAYGHNHYGSEFYDGSAAGQELVEGSSVPDTKIKWLNGSWRAAASECQGPWLSSRTKYWTEGTCPDHRNAYPHVILARASANRYATPHLWATEWIKLERQPPPNDYIWRGTGRAVSEVTTQEITVEIGCPAGPTLQCDYFASYTSTEVNPDLIPAIPTVYDQPTGGPYDTLASWSWGFPFGDSWNVHLNWNPEPPSHG